MSKNKQKKVLISGYIGFCNFGDDALLQVLTQHLKEKGCDITALSSDVRTTRAMFNIKALRYKNIFHILKGILTCDILISGGGNLLQNETSTKSLLYYLFIIFLAKLCFKKVFIFSQGIGPIKGFMPTLLTKLALKNVSDITLRDVYSQRILSKWKIHSKYCYDAVWNIKTPEYQPKDIVGIQLRNYKYLHKDYEKFLAKYIDIFFSDYEIRIYSFENKNDREPCFALQRAIKMRNPRIKSSVINYRNPSQIVQEFSHLKYLIAMRLHANILGLKTGVKVLPLSYNVKVRNLAYEFNLKFGEISEEMPLHSLLTDLTTQEQTNSKITDARKRAYEWAFLDDIINK